MYADIGAIKHRVGNFSSIVIIVAGNDISCGKGESCLCVVERTAIRTKKPVSPATITLPAVCPSYREIVRVPNSAALLKYNRFSATCSYQLGHLKRALKN
ncbi:MAG: hypothetical protein LBO67_09075 [Spirochaetaceae bacterium]|jgi:hypothetical protein|nr:hypothetical protein [Spirochaetaceae bacterium]